MATRATVATARSQPDSVPATAPRELQTSHRHLTNTPATSTVFSRDWKRISPLLNLNEEKSSVRWSGQSKQTECIFLAHAVNILIYYRKISLLDGWLCNMQCTALSSSKFNLIRILFLINYNIRCMKTWTTWHVFEKQCSAVKVWASNVSSIQKWNPSFSVLSDPLFLVAIREESIQFMN